MKIGIPKEIKDHEFRIGATPSGVKALSEAGHEVLVESGAGAAIGFSDDQYRRAGAHLGSREDVYAGVSDEGREGTSLSLVGWP